MTDYAALLSGQRLEQEEQARLAGYKAAWDYYDGKQAPPLKTEYGKPNDNTIVNLWDYIIDKGVAFLFGKPVEFQLAEDAPEEAIAYLDAVWKANRKATLLHKLGLNGGNCGHVFVKIVPREGDVPRLVNLDPAYVRPLWSPDDLDDVLLYKIEYEGLDENAKTIQKKQVIQAVKDANGVTQSWQITNYVRQSGNLSGGWTKVGEMPWGFPFAPIVDWQNLASPNEYFGRSDIQTTSLQDAVNFIASNTRKILRYHGHPKTWGSGFKAQEVNTDVDEMIVLSSPEAKVANLEMQSDLASSLNFFSTIRRLYLMSCHVPDLDPAVVNVGALSGFALRILYGDLLELTGKKQLTYGDGLTELNRRLLVLGGFEDVEVVGCQFKDPLPLNKTEVAGELDVEMNRLNILSKETAADDLGRDYEAEKERIDEEKQSSSNLGAMLLQAFERGGQAQPGTPVMPMQPPPAIGQGENGTE